jgi:hypothetical protein
MVWFLLAGLLYLFNMFVIGMEVVSWVNEGVPSTERLLGVVLAAVVLTVMLGGCTHAFSKKLRQGG